jgi:chaperonin GroES
MATKSAAAVKVNPLADRVVVKPLEETEQMRGGLYIPDTAKEKPQQGEIVAVGPGRFEKDKRVPMELKVGDRVLYGKYSGTEVTLDAKRRAERAQIADSRWQIAARGEPLPPGAAISHWPSATATIST